MADSYAIVEGFKLKLYDNGDGTFSLANAGVLAYSGALAAGNAVVGQVKLTDGTHVATVHADGSVPVSSVDTDSYFQSHDFTTTGAGPTLDLTASNGLVYSLQVIADGTVTSWTVAVEGSLDGTNWGTAHPLMTHASASLALNDVASATAKPLKYVRVNVTGLTLNAATKITAQLLALR